MEGSARGDLAPPQGTAARPISRIGLIAGPMFALVIYLLLPEQYLDAAGKATAFTHAGRATLAMLVWMAVWWMTDAVEIEVTSLLRESRRPADHPRGSGDRDGVFHHRAADRDALSLPPPASHRRGAGLPA